MPLNTNFRSLRFPEDVATDTVPNYITFTPQQVKYGGTNGLNPVGRPADQALPTSRIPTSIGEAVDQIRDGIVQSAGGLARRALSDAATGLFNSRQRTIANNVVGRISDYRNGILTGEADRLTSTGSISLFLPESLQTSSSVSYNAAEIGASGAAAANIVKGSNGDKLSGGDAIGAIAGATLTDLIKNSGNISAVNAITRNEVANNFSFQIFEGVGQRSFSYDWRMIPKSEQEAADVRDICNMFLYYMLPARKTNGNGSDTLHFYEVPAQWDIQYLRLGASMEFHQQPRACFLDSVDVSYGGDTKHATYSDGAPMETRLSLKFTEIEPLYRTDDISFGPDGNTRGQ